MRKAILGGLLALAVAACSKPNDPTAWAANHETTGPTRFPLAVDPAAVGTYQVTTLSAGGHFYDDVLEYRVWLHTDRGAERVAAGNDYFAAFAQYERAVAFAKVTAGAEQQPRVLVRQGERITEWRVQALSESTRGPSNN